MNIISIQSVDYGDSVYYNARTIFPNGEIKSLILSANACAVGDLSDKIMGEIDLSGKMTLSNKPCTIRHIQSTS
jgi:hypothetical protein